MWTRTSEHLDIIDSLELGKVQQSVGAAASFRYAKAISSLPSTCFGSLFFVLLDSSKCKSAGLTQLQKLQVGWCSNVTDEDVQNLAVLTNLTDLELARTKVSMQA